MTNITAKSFKVGDTVRTFGTVTEVDTDDDTLKVEYRAVGFLQDWWVDVKHVEMFHPSVAAAEKDLVDYVISVHDDEEYFDTDTLDDFANAIVDARNAIQDPAAAKLEIAINALETVLSGISGRSGNPNMTKNTARATIKEALAKLKG